MIEITAQEIAGQRWKFFLVLFAWPLFLVCLPMLYVMFGVYSLLLMVFPGVYLFTWLGYCMHECWHQYLPDLPNKLFYNLYSWMFITDPQNYRLMHGHHHSEVNTWADCEFHPLGEIKHKAVRQVYHALEIFLGVAFLVLVSAAVIPKHPRYKDKYRYSSLFLSIFVWILFLGGLGWLSVMLFPVFVGEVCISYLLMIWLGSFFLHQSQLVEHGNLIAPGDWNQRNLKTRNLRNRTLLEKMFLFLTHGDSREHVLHHSQPRIYSRPFPGRLPMPGEAVVISLGEHLRIQGDMLLGRDSKR